MSAKVWSSVSHMTEKMLEGIITFFFICLLNAERCSNCCLQQEIQENGFYPNAIIALHAKTDSAMCRGAAEGIVRREKSCVFVFKASYFLHFSLFITRFLAVFISSCFASLCTETLAFNFVVDAQPQ